MNSERVAGFMSEWVAGIIGIRTLGTFVLMMVDPFAVRWIMVQVVVVLLTLLVCGWRFHGQPSAPRTIGVGALLVMFTGAAQIGGPPVVVYWLGGKISSAIGRAKTVRYFAISTEPTGASYLIGGLITQSVMVFAWRRVALRIGPIPRLAIFRSSERNCFTLDLLWPYLGGSLFSLPILDQIMR